MERLLTAVLTSDVVGCSRLIGEDEAASKSAPTSSGMTVTGGTRVAITETFNRP